MIKRNKAMADNVQRQQVFRLSRIGILKGGRGRLNGCVGFWCRDTRYLVSVSILGISPQLSVCLLQSLHKMALYLMVRFLPDCDIGFRFTMYAYEVSWRS